MMRPTVLCLCLAGSPAAADVLGGDDPALGWGYDPRSAFTFRGQAIGVDGAESHAAEDALAGRWIRYQPVAPAVPNLRLQYSRAELPGRRSADEADYLAGETLSSDAVIDQYDATLYYELADSAWVSLDLGVNLRYLNANLVRLDAAANRREHSVDAYIPMVYAKALFELPFRGLSAGIEGGTSQYDGNGVVDYEAKLAYELNDALGLQGGWRHQRLRLDDRDVLGTDFESQGPFLDLYLRF